MSERGIGADAHPVRHLFGGGEVGDQRGGDAQPVRDDASDVDGRVAHALDGREHVQHARHLLRVAGRTRREHAHLPHGVGEIGEALFEVVHLVGHRRVGEEERGVGQVDHELGGVLGLREHGLQIAGLVVGRHRWIPRITAWTGAPGQRRARVSP